MRRKGTRKHVRSSVGIIIDLVEFIVAYKMTRQWHRVKHGLRTKMEFWVLQGEDGRGFAQEQVTIATVSYQVQVHCLCQ